MDEPMDQSGRFQVIASEVWTGGVHTSVEITFPDHGRAVDIAEDLARKGYDRVHVLDSHRQEIIWDSADLPARPSSSLDRLLTAILATPATEPPTAPGAPETTTGTGDTTGPKPVIARP